MLFTKRGIFGSGRVYADAAAGMPLSPRARREWLRLSRLPGNAGAIHTEGLAAKEELERARAAIARAIGAHADEIVFTGSGTEANNLAVEGVLRPLLRAGAAHALCLAIEHPSVLEPLYMLQEDGLVLEELPVDAAGLVDPAAVAVALKDETAFVSVQLVNSEIGTVEPVREAGKALRRSGKKVVFHTDAAQAPLWLPLNVEKLGVDLMTLDAQKCGGPKGVGALYVRRGTPLAPLVRGGGQEAGVRSGTPDTPAAGAFAAAFVAAQRRAARTAARAAARRDYLWRHIQARIPDAVLNGAPLGVSRVANNLNVSIPGLESQMAVVSLDSLGVAASTRSACSAGEDEPSHVLLAIGEPKELAGTAIRFTLLPDATYAQMRRVASALAETAARYRQ